MKNIKYLFYPFLFLLMLLYRALIFINEILYKKQIKKTHKIDLPIISVGNIEAGGTGKTPFVFYLVKILQDNGFTESSNSSEVPGIFNVTLLGCV